MTDLTSAEEIFEADPASHWDREVDVLVVGLGCAGACAAIEAARKGASVLVVEKASFGGGTSAMSGGVIYCGGGTSIQDACEFEDSVESMKTYLLASCGPAPDESKVSLYCEGSVEHFDWLVSLGVPFKPKFWPEYTEPTTDDGLYFSGCEHTYPFSGNSPPAPRGHVVEAVGSVGDDATIGAGRILMDALERTVITSGAEVVFSANLVGLGRDAVGRIVGARIQVEGKSQSILARGGVILTTGGFIANQAMVEEFAPRPWPLIPLAGAHDHGDGIRLGAAGGGATKDMDALAYMCPVLEPHPLVRGILVGRDGQRFVTEDVNHKRIAEQCLTQSDGEMYLLVDDEIFCKPRFDKPLIAVGETLDELEEALPFMPKGELKRTVARYNAGAAEGRDVDFGKRAENLKPIDSAPFGVFDCSLGRGQPYLSFTLGGLQTLPTGEVVDESGAPILGLYAAGRSTSGLSAQNCFASGIQLGEGTFFGRLAGKSAAQSAPSRPTSKRLGTTANSYITPHPKKEGKPCP